MKHKVYRNLLKNKARVLVIPINSIDIVSVGVFIKVGSRYENDKNNGISHFLEHLMFKGTKNFSSNKIFNELDNVGASYNAETGYEHTTFYINGHSEYIKLYLDILLDIYTNAIYREKDVDIERKVIYEEINMYKNDIEDIMNDQIHKIMFKNSSLKYPTLGTKKTLSKMTRKDIMDFRKKYYVPDRSVFVIAGSLGSFDKDKILKYINPSLENMQMGITDHIMPIMDHLLQAMPRVIELKYKTATPYICLCYRSQSYFSSYLEEYDVISHILTTGSSSRLYTVLREKLGLSYVTLSENITYQYEGAFCIYSYCDYKSSAEVVNAILKEIDQLIEKGITEEELNKAKQIKISTLSMSLQTPHDIMMYHGLQEVNYRVGNVNIDKVKMTKIKNIIDYIMGIKIDTVNMLIKNLFSKEKLNIIIVGNAQKSRINI